MLRRLHASCGSTGNCDGSTGSTGPLYRFLLRLNKFPRIALFSVHDPNLQLYYSLFVIDSGGNLSSGMTHRRTSQTAAFQRPRLSH